MQAVPQNVQGLAGFTIPGKDGCFSSHDINGGIPLPTDLPQIIKGLVPITGRQVQGRTTQAKGLGIRPGRNQGIHYVEGIPQVALVGQGRLKIHGDKNDVRVGAVGLVQIGQGFGRIPLYQQLVTNDPAGSHPRWNIFILNDGWIFILAISQTDALKTCLQGKGAEQCNRHHQNHQELFERVVHPGSLDQGRESIRSTTIPVQLFRVSLQGGQRFTGRVLFSRLLVAPLALAESFSIEGDGNLEKPVVVRPLHLQYPIAGRAFVTGLNELLQPAFVVPERAPSQQTVASSQYDPVDDSTCRSQTTIQINRSEQGFGCIGQDRRAVAATGGSLAAAHPDMYAQIDLAGNLGQPGSTNQKGFHLGQIAFGPIGEFPEEGFIDHQPENRIPEKLQPLIGPFPILTSDMYMGAVQKGVSKQRSITKSVTQFGFQRLISLFAFLIIAAGCRLFHR